MSEAEAHIVFFDTSALVKRYHREVGTDVVEAVFSDHSTTRMISDIGVIECYSAFARKVRTGDITEEEDLPRMLCSRLLVRCHRCLANEVVARVHLNGHELASMLLAQCGIKRLKEPLALFRNLANIRGLINLRHQKNPFAKTFFCSLSPAMLYRSVSSEHKSKQSAERVSVRSSWSLHSL